MIVTRTENVTPLMTDCNSSSDDCKVSAPCKNSTTKNICSGRRKKLHCSQRWMMKALPSSMSFRRRRGQIGEDQQRSSCDCQQQQQQLPPMEELTVTESKLDRRFVQRLRNSLPHLKHLTLNGNKLYRDPNLTKRLLSTLSSTTSNLQTLSLCWNGLGGNLAKVLSKRVLSSRNNTLQSLLVCGNPLGCTGIQSFVKEGQLHKVPSIDLWDCDIGDEGMRWLGMALEHKDCRIMKLVLDMNGIGDVGIQHLSKGLSLQTSLISLHLYCNDISDEGVDILFSALPTSSSFGELSLRANRITSEGAKSIASNLHKIQTKLDLSHNQIGDEGVQYLAVVLQQPPQHDKQLIVLKELNLSSNGLSNMSAIAMSNALLHNKTLRILKLDQNPNIDRKGAGKFVRCFANGSSRSLLQLEILDHTYDNHLLNDKIQFYTQVVHPWVDRKFLLSLPLAAWPRVLCSFNKDRKTALDHLFLVLRERPDILSYTKQE